MQIFSRQVNKSPLEDIHTCRPHQSMTNIVRFWVIVLALLLSLATLRLQAQLSTRNIAIEGSVMYANLPLREFVPRGKRSAVKKTEFHHVSPPSSELEDFFAFSTPRWDSEASQLQLSNVWKCSDDPGHRHTKLIFLHLTRSAGSTVRPFLRAYSNLCNRSIAVVSQCVDVGIESMKGDEIWRNDENSPQAAKDCWLSVASNRTGHDIEASPSGLQDRLNTAFLKSNEVDILAGHLPLGVDSFWLEKPDETSQYVTFLRHPLAKFVSQFLLVEKTSDLSIEAILNLIHRQVSGKISQGRSRDSFSSYFITPRQKSYADMENIEWTPERRVQLTLKNLVEYKIMVGLVEKLPESFEMLSYLVDQDQEVSHLTSFFSSPPESTKLHQKIGYQQRTREVVAAIEQNETLSSALDHFLRYELEIYAFAKTLHEYQYQWMISQTQSLSVERDS